MLKKIVAAMLLVAPMIAHADLTAADVSVANLRPADPAHTGLELETAQDKMQQGYGGEIREMTMTLVNAQGDQSQRKMLFEGIEHPSDHHDMTVMSFSYPADIKGSAILTHEQAEHDDDQWLYLPSVKRVKRIAAANQSGSFMGSEFSYEDLVVRQLHKYTFQYLGDQTLDGKDCYVIQRVPVSKNSGYSKVIRWRLKDNLQEYRTAYFDRKGDLLKIRQMEGHHFQDGFWRVRKITVYNVQTGKKSILTFDVVKLHVDLPEKHFEQEEFASAN